MAPATSSLRYISRRAESFDRYIREQVDQSGFGVEHEYFGITSPDRAEEVRRGLRRAGKHLGVAVKAFTKDCAGCRLGGRDCRHHIMYTSYDLAAAREYMRSKAASLHWGGPPR